jgi:hypothetical protein
MSKNRFIAATLTTIVLFLIVRFFTPEEVNDNSLLDAKEESRPFVETAVQEKVTETPQVVSKVNKPQIVPKQAPKVKIEQEEDKGDMLSSFSQKSEYVYFKIKDGLALVGGDIVLGELSEEQMSDQAIRDRLLKDKPSRSRLWPSSEIPFGYSEGMPEKLKSVISEAILYMNTQTVMNFFPADPDYDEDVIVFKLREGAPCSSYLGRVGGLQPIYLNSKCSAQDVLHEILHALAFVHEQQREDRDNYIDVLWENIEEEYQYNFSILPDNMLHPYNGRVFDVNLKSVMMYHDESFAKEGTKSMKARGGRKIAPVTTGLAEIDKERLDYLYGK